MSWLMLIPNIILCVGWCWYLTLQCVGDLNPGTGDRRVALSSPRRSQYDGDSGPELIQWWLEWHDGLEHSDKLLQINTHCRTQVVPHNIIYHMNLKEKEILTLLNSLSHEPFGKYFTYILILLVEDGTCLPPCLASIRFLRAELKQHLWHNF